MKNMPMNRLPLEIELEIAQNPNLWNYDVNVLEDRGRLIVWAISVHTLKSAISREDYNHLASESPLTKNSGDIMLPNLAVYLHDVRDDLKKAYDLSKIDDIKLYGGWFNMHGIKLDSIRMENGSEKPGNGSKVVSDFSEGVNLIGLPRAELGIGEDIRMMAFSCISAAIPFNIVEYPKLYVSSRQEDRSIEPYINEKQSKKINIFCFPALETIRAYADSSGPVFDGYHNIGYWPWELPYWPDKWLCALDLVDEIWCSTNYIADCLKRETDKPITVMPMAVELQERDIYQNLSREDLGISTSSYVFLNVFDGLSFPSRKNVDATVSAFQNAFPKDDKADVLLIIKSMNLATRNDPTLVKLKQSIANDNRLILFDDTVSKSELIHFYLICDAYISLHRSEGFGRTIAEAMLLGKPVIVSNYSGNVDFCKKTNSYLVSGQIIKVRKDEYHFTDERQYWFDADIDDATANILQCYNDLKGNFEKACRAKELIKTKYNAYIIGQKYRSHLIESGVLDANEKTDFINMSLQDILDKNKYISQIQEIPNNADNTELKRNIAVNANNVSQKVIAFYLPQFHPIKENNEWWGYGFTEWTNVTKAVPQFLGHYQPHLPADFGFYDLRSPEVLSEQISLAKHYGIFGFCFYYYWFSGRRILAKPLSNLLDNRDINFPFCICWANENWTRTWDGLDNEILISQEHCFEGDSKFIEDVFDIISKPEYIKIDGKPLLLIYRPSIIPEINLLVEVWRKYCQDKGLGEIMLGMIQSFNEYDPTKYGFDLAVEFPPHNIGFDLAPINNSKAIMNPAYKGTIIDYQDVIERAKASPALNHDYPWIRSCFPAWDNEARKPGAGCSFVNNTRKGFKEWFQLCVDNSNTNPIGGDKFVFINAWNEWAEGAHLEPDRHNGYMYLNVVAEVIESSK